MLKLLKEPLVQFLIGGFLLYGVVGFTGPNGPGDDDPYRIEINDRALALYLQYQDKAFDAPTALKALSALDPEARQRLTEEYIRDEVMVREAVALGFDQNDEVIRGRLIQKMDFIVQGFAGVDTAITEEQIEMYFEANQADYLLSAQATFTHIFFSEERRGAEEALLAAATLVPVLNDNKVPFERAGEYGDRFYFLRNYVTRPREFIVSHFGPSMTDQIFATGTQLWVGPFASKYGAHLILLRSKQEAKAPFLADVAGRVLDDLRREKSATERARAIAKLTEKYTLKYSTSRQH